MELPPNILRPTMRRAYCTGMRRCACSMKMTPATRIRPITITMLKTTQPLEVWTLHSEAGNVATTWVR